MLTPLGSHVARGATPTILSTRALLAQGMTRRQLEQCVVDGYLIRARNGRYLPMDTADEILHAVRLGGRVDCITLLHLLGVFVWDHHPHLHMQVTVGASRLPPRPRDVVRHWRVSDSRREDVLADLVEAIAQSCRCQEPRAAIATLDSAWHLGLIGEGTLAEVFARLPRRYAVLRGLLDSRSESGPETIMRLMLRALGCHVEVQVKLAGVGRVDFIVDGWLIVECDSEAHHSSWDAQKRDRRRDLAAAQLGYTTVRPIAEDILYRPEVILQSLKEILEHRSAATAVRNSSRKVRNPRIWSR